MVLARLYEEDTSGGPFYTRILKECLLGQGGSVLEPSQGKALRTIISRARNCDSLVANATRNLLSAGDYFFGTGGHFFYLVTKFFVFVASWRMDEKVNFEPLYV